MTPTLMMCAWPLAGSWFRWRAATVAAGGNTGERAVGAGIAAIGDLLTGGR